MKKKKKKKKIIKKRKKAKKIKKFRGKVQKKKRLKKTKRAKKSFRRVRKKRKSKNRKGSKEAIRKIFRLSEKFKLKIKLNFSLDQILQNFFQKIADKIDEIKQVIEEEQQKKRMERVKILNKEKLEASKKAKMIVIENLRRKQEEIREEQKIQKERKIELKRFIREEQAMLRKEQAERQKKFYEQIRLEKKIEQFRKREALEIKNLEKFVLKQERENYEEVQERIEKIKDKYQAIRDQKIRERIEQLGIEVSDEDNRSDLLEKERQFNLAREKIENNLESFFRSMSSCVFQLNRKWLPKKMSLLRVIDKRYESSEIFIKSDDEIDENWIVLVYLKDNDPNSNIVVEDKSNPSQNMSNEYQPNEIFKFSDSLVDSLTAMIDREYKRRLN